jgi:hypothetical protein
VKIIDPVSRGNIERLYSLNPETAATDYELFRKMNESDDFKKKMLAAAMDIQHGIFRCWSSLTFSRL